MAFACTKEIGKIEPTPYLELSNSKGVFIGCEGNFMYGNATLSYYDKNTHESYDQIFINTNNFPVGDVLQSTKIRGNSLYMMVNNSGKIYIVDKNTMVYKDKISGLVSPRYIEFINDKKAYITDLYSPSIAVLDMEKMQVTNGIFIGYTPSGKPRGTEEMIRDKDYVYTCSWAFSDKVYKINTSTDKVSDSLKVTLQPNSLVKDKNNKLWVLSDGSYPGSPIGKVRAALTKIDLEKFEVEQTFTFESDVAMPMRLRIDSKGENLYFVYGTVQTTTSKSSENRPYGVYKMDIEAQSLPQNPFISGKDKLIYSLGIDPSNDDIYIGDAVNYVQKSTIYRYDKNANLIKSFKSGITPGSFTFN